MYKQAGETSLEDSVFFKSKTTDKLAKIGMSLGAVVMLMGFTGNTGEFIKKLSPAPAAVQAAPVIAATVIPPSTPVSVSPAETVDVAVEKVDTVELKPVVAKTNTRKK